MIVTKFGGTSMADADAIRRVAAILRADARRKVCVVSAPGRTDTDPKITDLLYEYNTAAVRKRFLCIIDALRLHDAVSEYLDTELSLRAESTHLPTRLSLGDHMSAYILAQYLGWEFVDAVEVIRFKSSGVAVRLPHTQKNIVVPGFYGLDVETNTIAVFPRGGSDISGSYIAAACHATLYENWTDVSGVYTSDPRIDARAKSLKKLSYSELEHIGRSGSCVFHPDAILPVANRNIPIHIKNTFAPNDPGTQVQQPSS